MRCYELVRAGEERPGTPNSPLSGGSLVQVTGRLHNVAQTYKVRFSLQNECGLLIKVYQAALVKTAVSWEPGTELTLLEDLHDFFSRCCQNHHGFIKASEIILLTEEPLTDKRGNEG